MKLLLATLMAAIITGCGLPADEEQTNPEGISTAQPATERVEGDTSALECDYRTCMEYCMKSHTFEYCHPTCNGDCGPKTEEPGQN